MALTLEEKIGVLQGRVDDLERQIWITELEVQAEEVVSASLGEDSAARGRRLDFRLRMNEENKTRVAFFQSELDTLTVSATP